MFSDVPQSYITVIDEPTVNAQYCTICGKTFEKQRIVKWLLMRNNCRILLLQDVHQWASTICMTCQKTKNMTYSPPRKASLTLENQGRRAPVLSSYQSTTLTLCLQLHDLGSRQGWSKWSKSSTFGDGFYLINRVAGEKCMAWNLFFYRSICEEVSRISSFWWNFHLMDLSFATGRVATTEYPLRDSRLNAKNVQMQKNSQMQKTLKCKKNAQMQPLRLADNAFPIPHICHLYHLYVGGEKIWHLRFLQ